MLRAVVVASSASAAPSKSLSRCRPHSVVVDFARPSSSSLRRWGEGGGTGWGPRPVLFLPPSSTALSPAASFRPTATSPPRTLRFAPPPPTRPQIRPYVFLPATLAELVKDVRSFLGLSPSFPRTKLVLKLKEKRTELRTNYDDRKRKAKRAFESNRKNIKELLRRKGESFRARRAARREARAKAWNGLEERLNERRRAIRDELLRRNKIWTTSKLLRSLDGNDNKDGRRRKLLEGRLASVRWAVRRSRRKIDAHYRRRRNLLSSRLFGPTPSRVDGAGGGGAHETETTIVLDEPSSKSWFFPDGRPKTSRDPATGRFVNPWNSTSTDGTHAIGDVLEWRTRRAWGGGGGGGGGSLPAAAAAPPSGAVDDGGLRRGRRTADDDGPIVEADFRPPSPDESRIKLTWIGHSTVFVATNGFTVLTDPMFSERASPIQCPPFGVARYAPPACDAASLPPIDVCLVSHDHYDHCDAESISELRERGKVRRWVVPLGLKDWIVDNCGVERWRVREMEWWEEASFFKGPDGILRDGPEEGMEGRTATPSREEAASAKTDAVHDIGLESSSGLDKMTVACAPSQHWCGRTPFDRNRRLWCSFAVRTEPAAPSSASSAPPAVRRRRPTPLNFYFAGDTGLPANGFPLHRQIGDRYGPFDLAAIPIGAYEPRFFMKDGHCSPSEAVAIHRSSNCLRSVGVHWGAFALADERRGDPPRRLEEAVVAATATEEKRSALDDDDDDDGDPRRPSSIVDFVTIPRGGSVESPGDDAEERDVPSTSTTTLPPSTRRRHRPPSKKATTETD